MRLVSVALTSPIPCGFENYVRLDFSHIYPGRVTLCVSPEVETLRHCLWEKKPRAIILTIALPPAMRGDLPALGRHMALKGSCFFKPVSQSSVRRVFWQYNSSVSCIFTFVLALDEDADYRWSSLV